MYWKQMLTCLCIWFAAAGGAVAQTKFGLQTTAIGFTDVNGNGTLDCGEPVTFNVAVFSPTAIQTPAQTYSGSLTFPTQGTSGLIFVPGSVKLQPDLTVGCDGSVASGNGPEDLSAVVNFECLGSGAEIVPVFTVSYQAIYVSSSAPTYTAMAHAHVVPTVGANVDLGATARDTVVPSNTCTTAPNQVVVTKTERGTAAPGATIVYAITATDTSGLGAGGVQLTEVVPDNTTFAAASSDPGWVCPSTAAGTLCRLPAGNITPDGSLVRFFAVTVNNPLPVGVSALTNTACARGGPTTVLGCGSTTTATSGMAIAKMAKSVQSGTGSPGSTLVYQLTVSDSGNQDLGSSTIEETVPLNTTFDAASSDSGWSCAGTAAGSACTLTLASVPAGGSRSVFFGVDVAPTLPAGTTAISNTACVNSGSTLDCNSVTTPTTGTPVLSLHKSVAGTGAPGSALTYTVSVQNTGSEGASTVTVTEAVPDNTSFTAAGSSLGWLCLPSGAAGSACTITIPTLAAGATTNLTFVVNVASPLPASATMIANTACATLAGPPVEVGAETTCDTVTTPTSGAPHLVLVKSYGGGAVVPGAIISFGLTVTDTGNQDAGVVTLSEAVPLHSTFVSAQSSPGWSCTPGRAAGSSCTLALSGVAAGGSVSAVFAVQADSELPPATVIANAACATAAAGGQAVAACANATTPPELSFATTLAVALEVDADRTGTPTPGDTLRYTLVVPNATASTLQALVSRLELDPHEALVVGSVHTDRGVVATGNSAGDTTVVVNVGDLPAGSTATIEFDTKINLGLPVGTTQVTAQAETSGMNVPSDASSDPATPTIPHNPTSIAVIVAASIHEVPTLGQWGLLTLSGLLALGGTVVVRRRRV